MHSMRQAHRLGATWELLLDPATFWFFVGGLTVLLGAGGCGPNLPRRQSAGRPGSAACER